MLAFDDLARVTKPKRTEVLAEAWARTPVEDLRAVRNMV
jgi:hypothetical protein